MVKGCGGFVGGSRFKFQWGQKIYLYKKKKVFHLRSMLLYLQQHQNLFASLAFYHGENYGW